MSSVSLRRVAVLMFFLAFVGSCVPDVDAQTVGVALTIGAHPHNEAVRCTNPVRIGMYAAQAADALSAGAAASHGGISRTPFGASPALTFAAEQAALDVVIGALTRRASCGTKNLISGVFAGSALLNSTQNNSVSR